MASFWQMVRRMSRLVFSSAEPRRPRRTRRQGAEPESPVTIEVPRSNYRIRPGWTGKVDGGNDIAILILPELAPQDAQRFGIYRNTNEVGQIFQVVGYGRTNTALFYDPSNPL